MADYSEKDVLDYVSTLMNETQTARDDAVHFEKVHGMYDLPKLPPDLVREEAVYVLSPDPMHETKELKAQVLGYDTEIQCLATRRTGNDTVSMPDQTAVDFIEKAAATFMAKLDPDLYTYRRLIHDQIVKPLAIAVFECTGIDDPDPAKRFPWKLYDVELDGCGWLEERGVPTVAGRSFSQYVFKTAEVYSGRRDGPEGPGAQLYQKGNGAWDWKAASDDFTERTVTSINSSDHFEQCRIAWLDDGKFIYHVAINRPSEGWGIGPLRFGKSTKTTGKLVGKYPNTFGRVSLFLIGSNMTTGRTTQDRYLPFGLEFLATAENENLIDSMRATAARNRAAPRDYWNVDPEFLKEYMNTHNGQLPPATEWDNSKTPVGMGKLESRPVDVDPDIEKLDAKMQDRKKRYSSSSTTLRDPDILERATLGAVLTAFDSDNTSKSTLIGPLDVFRRQVIEAWEASVLWLGDPKNSSAAYDTGPAYAKFSLQAGGGRSGFVASKGEVANGSQFELTPKSFEVPHKWYVTTRQRSRGQATAEFSAAVERMAPLPDGRPNVGIYEDLFRAAGVSDEKERKATLAKESMLWESQPLVDQWLKDSIAFEIENDSGVRVQLLGANQAPGGAPPPGEPGGQVPPGGMTVNSPVTNPAEGGSGAAFQTGG